MQTTTYHRSERTSEARPIRGETQRVVRRMVLIEDPLLQEYRFRMRLAIAIFLIGAAGIFGLWVSDVPWAFQQSLLLGLVTLLYGGWVSRSGEGLMR
jgi:hypothetical protein